MGRGVEPYRSHVGGGSCRYFWVPPFTQIGNSTWSEDQLLLVDRNGYLEECYFTWSHSPIVAEDGKVGGAIAPVSETTQRVVGERRLR